jgi:hypothetical protein
MIIQEEKVHIMSSITAELPQLCEEKPCKTTVWAAEATVISPWICWVHFSRNNAGRSGRNVYRKHRTKL